MRLPREHNVKSRRSRHSGFTLLTVLVAMVVAGLGLLGVVRAVAGLTASNSQNQMVASLATVSNGFWGVIQTNRSILLDSSLSGTQFTAANYTTGPAALQSWLRQATQALPGAAITVTTGPDSASGSACSIVTGCSATLQISWTMAGTAGLATSTRTQNFYYQFGL